MRKAIGIKKIIIVISLVFFTFTLFAGAQTVKPVQKDEYNIAYIGKALGVAWYESLRDALVDEFKKIAKENNVVINVSTQECQNRPEVQVEYMRAATMRKVDAMMLLTTDAYAAIPEVIEANKAAIPVITVVDAIYGGEILCDITYDYVESGRMPARYIVEKLTERYGKPEGKVVELTAILGASTTMDRTKGFNEVINQYPGIDLIAQQAFNFSPDLAITVFTNILQSNPKIDAVYAHTDEGIQGVIQASKSMGRFYPIGHPEHIITVGSDAPYVGLEQIRKKEQDATIDMGSVVPARKAARVVWDYIRNGVIPTKQIKMSLELIDTPEKTLDPNLWGNIYKL